MFIPQVYVKKSRKEGLFFVALQIGARSVERPDATIYRRLSGNVDYRIAHEIQDKEIKERNKCYYV